MDISERRFGRLWLEGLSRFVVTLDHVCRPWTKESTTTRRPSIIK
jgi:hypothetical protein